MFNYISETPEFFNFLLLFLLALPQSHSIISALHHSLFLWRPKGDLLRHFPSCGHLYCLDVAGSEVLYIYIYIIHIITSRSYWRSLWDSEMCEHTIMFHRQWKEKLRAKHGYFAAMLYTLNTQVRAMMLQSQSYFSIVCSMKVSWQYFLKYSHCWGTFSNNLCKTVPVFLLAESPAVLAGIN